MKVTTALAQKRDLCVTPRAQTLSGSPHSVKHEYCDFSGTETNLVTASPSITLCGREVIRICSPVDRRILSRR